MSVEMYDAYGYNEYDPNSSEFESLLDYGGVTPTPLDTAIVYGSGGIEIPADLLYTPPYTDTAPSSGVSTGSIASITNSASQIISAIFGGHSVKAPTIGTASNVPVVNRSTQVGISTGMLLIVGLGIFLFVKLK